MKPQIDWKALRKRKGLSTKALSALTQAVPGDKSSGYSITTINALENHGVGSARLKELLRGILGPQPELTESENHYTIRNMPNPSPSSPQEVRFQEALTEIENIRASIDSLELNVRRLRDDAPAPAPRGNYPPPENKPIPNGGNQTHP